MYKHSITIQEIEDYLSGELSPSIWQNLKKDSRRATMQKETFCNSKSD
jgi:hypothetical protein